MNGQKVPASLAIQVRLSNYLTTQNLQPEHTAQNGAAKYYRIQTSSREIVAIQYADGRVKMLEGRELGTYNSRIARKRADDAAREAIDKKQPLPDQVGEGKPLVLPKDDLGASMEGIQTQQTQPVEQKPVEQQPAQPEPAQQQKPAETPRKKIDNGIITKPVTPSENQGKTYNFGKELRNPNSRTHTEIKKFLTNKGKFNENMSLNDIKRALKEFNISYDTVTNEESLIEMLNNCR
jgi:hypothetical protein